MDRTPRHRDSAQESGSPYPIGRLADLTGLPIKTIRFYSDKGLLPPTGRTDAGHRRYGERDLARLQLIRSLQDLGLELEAIQVVLDGHHELASVLRAHIGALDVRIRSLLRQRAVLRAAITSPSEETMMRVHALAQLDRRERHQLLEHFWDEAIGGLPMDPAVADRFRAMGTPDLPDDSTPAQLDAWIELALLASDEDFQRTTRRNAVFFHEAAGGRLDTTAWAAAIGEAMAAATEALEAEIAPTDPRARPAVDSLAAAAARMLGRDDSPEFRAWLAIETRAHTDPRAERFWRLTAFVRGGAPWGEPPQESKAREAMAWLMEALATSG